MIVDRRLPDTAEPTVTPAPPTAARIIGLDGARGISCLGVAIAHIANYSPTTLGGKAGIVGMTLIFFYGLSGFLLFLPYVRNLTADRSSAKVPSAKNFALHRIARIVPGYLAIFLICNYVFHVVYVQNPALQPLGTDNGTGMMTDPWQLLANLTLVHSYFPAYFQTGLNPSWSLTLEFAFYASLPIFGLLIFALRKRTTLHPFLLAAIPALVLIVIGFVGRALAPMVVAHFHITDVKMIDWGPNWAAVYLRSILANADSFAFGMLAAVVIVAMEQRFLRETLSRRMRLYSALALIPALVLSAALLGMKSYFGTSAISLAAGLSILVIVAPLARGQKSGLAQILDVAPMRFVGKVALSAYLWHFPILLLLGRWGLIAGDSVRGLLQNIALVLTVTFLVSTVTYYLIEQPAMNAARRYRHRWA